MTLFWIAVPIAIAITVVYAYQMVAEFRRLRSSPNEPDPEPVSGVGSFAVKAVVGVVGSVSCLLLVSYTSWGWYLLPALAMGSAVAVIGAFRIDARSHEIAQLEAGTTDLTTVQTQ